MHFPFTVEFVATAVEAGDMSFAVDAALRFENVLNHLSALVEGIAEKVSVVPKTLFEREDVGFKEPTTFSNLRWRRKVAACNYSPQAANADAEIFRYGFKIEKPVVESSPIFLHGLSF